MEVVLIMIGIVWIILPIPLLVLWLNERSARKQREKALQDYLNGTRVPMQPYVQYPPMPPQGYPMPQQQMPPPMQGAAQFVPPTYVGAPPVQQLPQPVEPVGHDILPENPDVPVTETPVTETPAVTPAETDTPQTERAAAETPSPQVTPPPFAPPQMPQQLPSPQPVKPVQRDSGEFKISAITAMLAVGVILVVFAGLLFVRSQWESLGNTGKLVTLAAGSVLFFGASALARKTFNLERTGMAFFVIGTAFLPISVWAAGYFGLLGESLSDPASNLLIGLAFLSFTIIALIAVRIYMQLGWGVGFLCGLTLTYVYLMRAILAPAQFEDDFQYAMLLIFTSCWALLFAYLSRTVKNYVPLAIARALEPFAICITILNALLMLGMAAADESYMLYGAAGLLAAAAFFSPVITERLRNFTAIPVGLTALLGFWRLFEPLHTLRLLNEDGEYVKPLLFYGAAYWALILIVCALLYQILLLTKSLPDNTKKGFLIGTYVFTIGALLPQLECRETWALVIASCVLLVTTAILALRTNDLLLRGITGAVLMMVCLNIAEAQTWVENPGKALLKACLLLGSFLLLCAAKRLRTHFSDFASLILASVFASNAIDRTFTLNGWAEVAAADKPVFIASGCVLAVIPVIYWFLATAHDTTKPHQYAYAVLLPSTLFGTALLINDAFPHADTSAVWLVWSLVSYAIGLLAYFTVKRRFHGVRRLLFALTIVPPMVLAAVTELVTTEHWYVPLLLLAAAMALLLWQLLARRGFRKLSVAGFAVSLGLVLEATWYALNLAFFDDYAAHSFSFTVWMLNSLWIVALSILAIVISRKILFFVGSEAIPKVMQFAAPIAVLLLSMLLLSLNAAEWASLFPVFTIGLCVLAWLTTKRTHVILPALCSLALIFSLEAVRQHLPWHDYSGGEKTAAVVIMLLCFAGMTVLFPYLGAVLREGVKSPEQNRRAYTLTWTGALIPVWLLMIASASSVYTEKQREWLYFFVPVLAAGYLLHFAKLYEAPTTRKAFLTASAACLLIACWMQPLVSVTDTYWEGKLHLLPLIAFGVLLRYLYGSTVGGNFLFGIGVYSMLRLGIAAITRDTVADFLTVLIAALAVFLVSFYVKQKKWFLLGGAALIVIAIYVRTKLGVQWWVFLLLAGMVLIGVAGTNEMFKKRGESLTEKAGRLWQDWEW